MQQQYDGTATTELTKGIWSSFGILCSTILSLLYLGVKQGSLGNTRNPTIQLRAAFILCHSNKIIALNISDKCISDKYTFIKNFCCCRLMQFSSFNNYSLAWNIKYFLAVQRICAGYLCIREALLFILLTLSWIQYSGAEFCSWILEILIPTNPAILCTTWTFVACWLVILGVEVHMFSCCKTEKYCFRASLSIPWEVLEGMGERWRHWLKVALLISICRISAASSVLHGW